MKSVIFNTFNVQKYLMHMGWKKVPESHWAAGQDGQVVMFDGMHWRLGSYMVEEKWLGE